MAAPGAPNEAPASAFLVAPSCMVVAHLLTNLGANNTTDKRVREVASASVPAVGCGGVVFQKISPPQNMGLILFKGLQLAPLAHEERGVEAAVLGSRNVVPRSYLLASWRGWGGGGYEWLLRATGRQL